MAIDLRLLSPQDRLQLPQLMNDAFGRGRIAPPPTVDASLKPQSECLGVFEGERLVAATTIHDCGVVWHDRTLRMGGLGGVACATDRRGRGYAGRLLKETLVVMREAGRQLSGLYPFSYSYYRQYGWEWVGEKRRYTVPLSEVRSYPELADVSLVNVAETLPEIKTCYAEFARRYRGMTDRLNAAPNWWRGLEDRDDRRTYVYGHRDPSAGVLDGYLSVRFPDEGDTGQVGDFFANSPAAYRGLLSILHNYATQFTKATWTAPMNDPFPTYLMHTNVQTIINPLFMGRIVDMVAAFESMAIPADVEGKVILSIDDRSCDWNSGTFEVEASGGGVSVRRSSAGSAGIRMDIPILSQAFWGHPSFDLLVSAGHVNVVDEAQARLLSRILPPAPTYLQDFF